MALFAVGGCGSDDEESGGTGGSGGGSGGSTGGSGGSTGGSGGATGGTAGTATGGTAGTATGGTAGSSTGGTAGAAGGGGGLTCAAFCAAVAAACTGANVQYASENECMTACAGWPVGTEGATSGDTLACRMYHAGVAATDPQPDNANTHCPHAGADGGGVGGPCTDP